MLSANRCVPTPLFFSFVTVFFCELQGGQGSSLYRWWAHWFGVLRQEPELAFDHGNWRVIPPMPSPFPRTMMINNPSIWPAVSWSKRGIAGAWKRLKEPFGEWRRLFCSKPIILYARHFWGIWGLVVPLIFWDTQWLEGRFTTPVWFWILELIWDWKPRRTSLELPSLKLTNSCPWKLMLGRWVISHLCKRPIFRSKLLVFLEGNMNYDTFATKRLHEAGVWQVKSSAENTEAQPESSVGLLV